VDLRNTLRFDELTIVGKKGLETPHRISESMVRLKTTHNALRSELGLTHDDVVDVRGVVRWNHNEFTFPTYRHEVMLFTDHAYNKTTRLTELANESWLRCKSGPCSAHELVAAECNPMFTGASCRQSGRIRIAFLGDSLTRGNALHEASRRGPVHVQGRGNFPLRLQSVLNFWNVSNFGHGGTTVQQRCGSTAGSYADTVTFAAAMTWAANVYVIMLGTNDVLSCWDDARTFLRDFMTLVHKVLDVAL